MSTVFSVPIAVAMEKSAAWKARGLVVTGQAFDDAGLPLIAIDAPADVLEEMMTVSQKSVSNQPKRTGLAGILARMYEAASSHPGKVQRQVMGHGMGVDVIVFNGVLRMQIWRAGETAPSITEWQTTCKYFPVALAERDPERFAATIDGQARCYLRAAWRADDPTDESAV